MLGLATALGCATVPLAPRQEDEHARRMTVPAGKALVYVYRSGWTAWRTLFPLFANSERIGDLARGTYYVLEVDPGELRLDFPYWDRAATLSFDARAGERYFVRQRIERMPIPIPPLIVVRDAAKIHFVGEAEGASDLGRLVRLVPLTPHADEDARARAAAAPEGGSVIYVLRLWAAPTVDFDVVAGGRDLAKLPPHAFVALEAPPGAVTLAVQAENLAEISLDAEPGKARYVLALPTMGWLRSRVQLRELDPSQGSRLMSDLRLAGRAKLQRPDERN